MLRSFWGSFPSFDGTKTASLFSRWGVFSRRTTLPLPGVGW